MLLVINGDRLIKDVQQEFASAYPYLKIEFFKKAGFKDTVRKHMPVEHNQKLNYVKGTNFMEGELLIDDRMTVTDLEKIFMEKFGLQTQVFRRSGNIWLETSITDNWSLKQQNDHGKEIALGNMPGDKTVADDYDLKRDAD